MYWVQTDWITQPRPQVGITELRYVLFTCFSEQMCALFTIPVNKDMP